MKGIGDDEGISVSELKQHTATEPMDSNRFRDLRQSTDCRETSSKTPNGLTESKEAPELSEPGTPSLSSSPATSVGFRTGNVDIKTSAELADSKTDTDGPRDSLIRVPQEPATREGSMKSFHVRGLCRISPELRTVLFVAFVIHLEITAYSPVETLQSSLNSEAGLGTLSLACLYGPYFIFAIAAPIIVRTLTPKWTMFVAWAFDCCYIGANFHPTWFTLVPTAVLTGSITGPLWTAKDLYISQMARKTTLKKTQRDDEFHKVYQNTLSFYNGIVFAGIAFSQVLGQLISSVVLTQSSREAIEELNCGAFHCSSNLPVLLNVTNGTSVITSKPEKSLVYILIGILVSLVIMAMLLTAFGIRQIPFSRSEASVKSTILSCAVRLIDIKILLMIPQIVLFGFSHGMIQSDYTRSYVTCGKGVGMLGYVMISQGICGSSASLACGRLVKYTGRRLQAVLALCGYVGLYAMMWLWTPTSDANVTLYLVIPIIFGVTDVVFQTHICTIIAVMFEDDHDRPAAFANFYTFRALSKALSFGLSGFVCVWIKLSVVTVLLVLAIISFVILELLLTCAQVEKPKEELTLEVTLINTNNKDESLE